MLYLVARTFSLDSRLFYFNLLHTRERTKIMESLKTVENHREEKTSTFKKLTQQSSSTTGRTNTGRQIVGLNSTREHRVARLLSCQEVIFEYSIMVVAFGCFLLAAWLRILLKNQTLQNSTLI